MSRISFTFKDKGKKYILMLSSHWYYEIKNYDMVKHFSNKSGLINITDNEKTILYQNEHDIDVDYFDVNYLRSKAKTLFKKWCKSKKKMGKKSLPQKNRITESIIDFYNRSVQSKNQT